MINTYRLLTFWLMLNILTATGLAIANNALTNTQDDTSSTGSIYSEVTQLNSLTPERTEVQQSFDSTSYQQSENNYEKSPGSMFGMGMNILGLFAVGLVPFVHMTLAHDSLELMVLLVLDVINTFILVYLIIKAYAFFKNKGGE